MTGVLGRGGMGVVWRASDELIGRTVAVKELRAPHGLSGQEREVFSERALREARTAGRLNHSALVAIYDLIPITPDDEAAYIVMELVEAPSLAQILEQEGALPEWRVARLGLGALAALNEAHAISLVHRDVKPSNILVLPGDKAKLVDFGIAHAIDDTRLTRHGVAGSTGYMAPELFEGNSPSPAADLWSLGATLFHAVAGTGPFDRASTAATLHAILYDDPPSLSEYPSLGPLIGGLLTRDREHRMTSEQAMAALRTAADVAPSRQGEPDGVTGTVPHQADADSDAFRATWEVHPTSVRPMPPPEHGTNGPQGPFSARSRASTPESHPATVRSQMLRQRQALAGGDERYLPARDKGPIRRFARDWVDSRVNVAEFFLPLAVVILVLSVVQMSAVQNIALLLWPIVIGLMVLDAAVSGIRLKKRLEERFPDENTHGAVGYALQRSLQMRRLRLPRPQVKRGEQP
ncbi:DUF3043 domain-containing protein [Streptomyces sp. NBC_01450]|uniref:DUF3043 domain-containing protein n=1 Tax=Streptomyces sp. NBC_01450 TaxID=2903871 RepID=UPI002E34BE48|nr:DUF3043 domain-containing protein [Streptomyces sp. NBC_01450]